MRAGPLVGQRFPVQEPLVLGRADADVTIDDPLVSRRHALVRPLPSGAEIEDLGSLNGTWVNEERITSRQRLAPGDVIRIGNTIAELEGDQPAHVKTVLAPSPVAGEHSLAPPHREAPHRIEDELRTVTALFADVVGSTSLGEKLAPHEVKALIGESVTRMSREAERFGGWVQAYMGDGIAVFFGVPVVHEDDPERAARAALAIQEVVRDFATAVEAEWGITNFAARIGINTGQVAVGLVGAAEPQPVSIGDATNVAARLQSMAEPGTIAVGKATARALVHRFSLEPLGDLSLKGREQPVPAWRLVSAEETEPVREHVPLVDRRDELARLGTALDELEAGRGQVVLLVGDAGIGKTRLLAEVCALAAGRATWLEGHCLSFGAERLYDPFIRMLRTWIGAEEGEEDAVVRMKLRAKLELVPDPNDIDDTRYLGRLLGLAEEREPAHSRGARQTEETGREIRRAYRRWLQSLTARGPVVVALEDLHWADASTCDLVDELLELTDHAPLMLVGTMRQDTTSRGWGLRVRIHAEYPHRIVEQQLGPLTDGDARRLLDQLHRSDEVDSSSHDLIVATAEGNPLYLEELLTGFADGAAERRGTTWAPAITHRGLLTPTLENLMMSQIDRLAPEARKLAQIAAVIGRRFPRRVLERLAADDDLSDELAELLRAGVIREARRYPEPEYAFRHGLLRQAALSTLLPPRLRELSGAVAAAVESVYASSLDEQLERLAYYYRQSDNLSKALEYLELAADRAVALDATDDAIELWETALDVCARLGGDASVQERLEQRIARARVRDSAHSP
jgi:class 3 adenylate cyclase